MHIGINEVLIHDHSGGAQQREISILPELLRQIADMGWRSTVYVSREISEALLKSLVQGAPCSVARTPIPSIPTYKRLIYGIPYWSKQVCKDRLDLFHTAYYPSPRLKIPVVFTAHDVRFKHMPATYTKGREVFLRFCVPYTFRKVSRIIAVSEDTREDIVNFWGIDRKKIDISYNAVNQQYSPVSDRSILEKVKDKYSLPETFILCVSHLEPRKNLHRLLQAYRLLCDRHRFTHDLVILGKPIFGFESLFKDVREDGEATRIHFSGFVDDEDMAAVYSMAEVLVFPSLHEGFGMPAVEAMACGVPVVASNVSALPEVCGNAAVLVDPYDHESIMKGILKVLSDTVKKEELVRKGYLRTKQFSAKNAASSIILSYQRALGEV